MRSENVRQEGAHEESLKIAFLRAVRVTHAPNNSFVIPTAWRRRASMFVGDAYSNIQRTRVGAPVLKSRIQLAPRILPTMSRSGNNTGDTCLEMFVYDTNSKLPLLLDCTQRLLVHFALDARARLADERKRATRAEMYSAPLTQRHGPSYRVKYRCARIKSCGFLSFPMIGYRSAPYAEF